MDDEFRFNRLSFVPLAEISDDWESGKICLDINSSIHPTLSLTLLTHFTCTAVFSVLFFD